MRDLDVIAETRLSRPSGWECRSVISALIAGDPFLASVEIVRNSSSVRSYPGGRYRPPLAVRAASSTSAASSRAQVDAQIDAASSSSRRAACAPPVGLQSGKQGQGPADGRQSRRGRASSREPKGVAGRIPAAAARAGRAQAARSRSSVTASGGLQWRHVRSEPRATPAAIVRPWRSSCDP